MIEAWSTDAVYAAEGALMATLDEGELMARAVEGLAGVAAARLEECGGESVAALVGPGNNGADALYAVARLAEAGWNAVAVHHDHVHEAGPRRPPRRPGVVLTTDPERAGRGRRRARRHPRHRRPPGAARLGGRLARRRSPRPPTSSPSTCPRARTRWVASSTPTASSPTRR